METDSNNTEFLKNLFLESTKFHSIGFLIIIMKIERVSVSFKQKYLLYIQTVYNLIQVNIVFFLFCLRLEFLTLYQIINVFNVLSDYFLKYLLTVW